MTAFDATSSLAMPSTKPATQGDRTLHDVLLGLLAAFDEVCRTHGLTYIATHGTLLGAMRNHGFVPWDDDLDVAMPRVDYERLLQLADQGVFPNPYFLQTPENESGCFYGGFAKLRDSSSAAIEEGRQRRTFNQGIWVDILPLDHCPADDTAVERRQRQVRTWQRLLYAKTYNDAFALWDADPRKLSAYFLMADHLSRKFLCRNLKKACTGCNPTGTLTVFAANYRRKRNDVRYAVKDVEQAVRVPFEDTTVPVPRNAEQWLAARYGDLWRNMPESAPQQTHQRVHFEPNMPYAQMIGGEATR